MKIKAFIHYYDNPLKNKEKAIELLNTFIKEKLNGNIHKLKDYSFWDVDRDKIFGNGLSYPDGDRTRIMYAIDYLLYFDILKDIDFRIYGYSTKESTYSGETLNTFNTLFSSQQEKRDELAGIYGSQDFQKDCYDPESDCFSNDFYHVYQRLGNFSILPCLTICGGSINTWKGTDNKIRDYLYPFLISLKEAYGLYNSDYKPTSNIKEYELLILMKCNKFFFDNDKVNTFDKFINLFMLEGWENLKLDQYLKCSEINETNIYVMKDYVKKATEFINNRSKRIIKKLDIILNYNGEHKYEKD